MNVPQEVPNIQNWITACKYGSNGNENASLSLKYSYINIIFYGVSVF
jgi:hypothetical protein